MRAPRAEFEDHNNHERWLVSYADFITLLFAFFTVLYATADRNLEKQKQFEESIRDSMKSFLALGGGAGGGRFATLENNASPVEHPIQLFRKEDESAAAEEAEVKEAIRQSLTGPEIDQLGVEVVSDNDGVRVLLPTDAIFEGSGTKFYSKSVSVLTKLVRSLPYGSRDVAVEAHTSLKEDGAWDLSAARGATFLRFLLRATPLSPKKVLVTAYGSERPLNTQPAESATAQNRRIEILLKRAEVRKLDPAHE